MTWMKAIAKVGLSTAAMGALAIGCSSTPDEVPVDPLAKEEGFCSELAKVVCNANVVDECYGSVDSTRADDTKSCVDNATRDFCNSQNAVYRAVNAQKCIDAYKAGYADAALELTELDAIDEACHPTLSGNGDAGEACEIDQDCNGAEELRCVAKPGSAGTCEVPEEIGPGLACDGAAQTCASGFYCSAEAGACIVERAVGQSCSETQPCDAESRCEATTMMCEAKDANGTTCTAADSCTGGFCDIADGSIDGTCKAAQPINTTNGTCAAFLP